MEKELIGHCPVCSSKLIATELTCKNCDLQIKGDFALNKYSFLTKDESLFLETFLGSEGSFKAVQEELDITYLRAKEELANILDKLGIKEKKYENNDLNYIDNLVSFVNIEPDDHFITKLIKDKLNKEGGKAEIPLIQAGKSTRIAFDPDERGLISDKIPIPDQLTWDVFIAAYNILIMKDGQLYKGYARTGKLGSERLPLDSLEGYIAAATQGVSEGESAFSPGFVIAAVLDWIGILINERGSTLQAKMKSITVSTYSEALENAKIFLEALDTSTTIKHRLKEYRHWYYFSEIDAFVPGKFIAYRDIDWRTYDAYNAVTEETDKGTDVKFLLEFFSPSYDSSSDLLKDELNEMLDGYDIETNTDVTIYVKK